MAQFAKRTQALKETGEVDWGLAEALAFASLLSEGTPIRISGQDTERGTFSHRHAVLHDARTNEKYVPLQHLNGREGVVRDLQLAAERVRVPGIRVRLRLRNPQRAGALGSPVRRLQQRRADHHRPVHRRRRREVGPADTRSRCSCRTAYEGAGPEHSSARLERFLQLSAEGNIRVANCSTAAQYFHLLRAQAKATQAYPLVVMTPKSSAAEPRRLRDDRRAREGHVPRSHRRPALRGQGQVRHRARAALQRATSTTTYVEPALRKGHQTAIVRVELLSPLPLKKSSNRSPATRTPKKSSGSRKSRRTWAPAPTSAGVWSRSCRTA